MQMDLKTLWAHLHVIYPAEAAACSSVCSYAGERNNSRYSHVTTLPYNPAKRNQRTPTKVGLGVQML